MEITIDYDQIYLIVVCVLSAMAFFPVLILLVTQCKFKQKKIKEDILLIERYALYIIFIIINLTTTVLLYNDKYNSLYKDIMHFSFLFYINIYIMNIIAVNIEFYNSIKNPFYKMLSIFSNKKKNIIWEILIFVTSPAFFLISHFMKKFDIFDDKRCFIDNKIVNGTIGLSMVFIVIFQSLSLYIYQQLQNKSKRTLLSKFISLFINSFLLIIYSTINYIELFNEGLINDDILRLISVSLIIVIIFVDAISSMCYIKKSDYYYYYLGKKKSISKYYKMCTKNKYYKQPIYDNATNTSIKKEIIMNTFLDKLSFNNLSQLDIELSEYSLNVALASIAVVFDKVRKANNESITVRSEKQSEMQESLLSENNRETHDKYMEFFLSKGNFTGNMIDMINVSNNILDKDKEKEQYKNNVNVDIKYYYYDKFVNAIMTKGIDLSDVKASLLSHSSKTPYLLSKNSNENYFQSMKTLSIKTKDKKIMIEIFPNIMNSRANCDLIEKYIDHMTAKKNGASTFLPFLLGVFKIQINSFSSFTVFISKNSIIESVPNDVFNYWQFMRYGYNDQIERIETSKDRTSICITDDNLFNGMKILLRSYKLFNEVLENDFNFLKEMNAKNFSVLIMYYEFDQAGMKSISIEPNEDVSKIRISTSNFRISDIKNFNFSESGDTICELDKDFSAIKYSKDGNGFEAMFNNFKSILFFSFENVFEFRGHSFKSIDYNKYKNDLLKNFDYLNLENE